ncbi:MAG TPA: hypothetical protein VFM34_06265, partial [Moraxellaceae bacterium]|nr:hypothetical protein [Moraxellaceae bacterium]
NRARARTFAAGLLPPKAHVFFMADGALPVAWLDLPGRALPPRRSLLHVPPPATTAENAPAPPFHYSEDLPEAALAGWVFPPDWVFGHDALLNVLFSLRDTLRVKGVFHTDRGWIFFNATRLDTGIHGEAPRADSRVEVIASAPPDWAALEAALLATRLEPPGS